MKTTKRVLAFLLVVCMLAGYVVLPVGATGNSKKYIFSEYTAGVQYAKNEVHVLDEDVTVVTDDAHFTTELRLYDSASNDSTAVIQSAKKIESIVLNAGNKAATLNVYGSTDGNNWALVSALTTTSAYADHEVSMPAAYTYLKLDAVGAQIRIKYMTITFASEGGSEEPEEPVETKPVETEPVETEPVETEPVETKPVETDPVETKPVETDPVETKPVETDPVETEPQETEAPKEPTPEEIVDAAYNLADGETLEGTYTLTGEITKIDTAYSEQYKNITVTIVVAGRETKPIQCFRLAGEGAADLAVRDVITVTGTLKNFKGTIEFDKGCTLDKVVKAEPEEPEEPEDPKPAPSTPEEIVDAAYNLAEGETLEGTYTLTGEITTIDTAYSEQYKNITVTIVVAGRESKPIKCFRLAGEGAADLAARDVITVTGTLKNHYGTIEFDAGCTLDKVVKAEPEDPAEAPDAVLSFADLENRVSFSTEQQVWQSNGITFTNDKASSTNDVADYANPVRLYAGSTVKIEYPGMTKIVFTCKDKVLAEADISALGTVSPMGNVVTLELAEAADCIEFTLSVQTRFAELGVYGTGAAVDPEEPAVGSEENPEQISFNPVSDISLKATVTVPANTEAYYVSFVTGSGRQALEMVLDVDGDSKGVVYGDAMNPYVMALSNKTDEAVTKTLTLTYLIGSQMNPDQLRVFAVGESEDDWAGHNLTYVEADNWDGYFYQWTAPLAGELTITLENGKAGWSYSIYNMSSGQMTDLHCSCDVPVVNSETIVVNTDDVIQVNVNSCGADSYTLPGGTISMRASYAKYVGTEENPEQISFNPVSDISLEAAVTVPANTEAYYVSFVTSKGYMTSEMMLSIDGEEYGVVCGDAWEPVVIALTNETEEDVTYTLTLTNLVGSRMNPAELVIGKNSCEIEADSWDGYLYQWIATYNGDLTITMDKDVPSWSYVVNNLTSDYYGDITQSPDGAASETVAVSYGDVIQITINTAYNYDTWTSPAGTVSFTAEFAPAVGAPENPEELNMKELQWGSIWRDGGIPAGSSYSYSFYSFADLSMQIWGNEGMVVSVNGVDYMLKDSGQEILIPASRMGNTITITNNGEYYNWYGFDIYYPYGSMENPQWMNVGTNTIKLPANSADYHFCYHANETGYLTLTMTTKKNWTYTVMKRTWKDDEETGESYQVTEPVVDTQIYGDGGVVSKTIEVKPGDEIYMIVNTKDYKAGTISFTAAFARKSMNLMSGKSMTLSFTNPANGKKIDATKVNWAIEEIYAVEYAVEYGWYEATPVEPENFSSIATLSNSGKSAGKFTAVAGATVRYDVFVKASLKSDEEVVNNFWITITPATTGIQIEGNYHDSVTDETILKDVTGKTIDYYINSGEWFYLQARTAPERLAMENVVWTSSNTKVLKINEYGILSPVFNSKTQKYNEGTVTITATAADGSGVKASVKVNVSWLAEYVNVSPKTGQWQLGSGKSMTMVAEVDSWATNKAVDWSVKVVEEQYDWMNDEVIDPATVATINEKGVLTAAKDLTQAYSVQVTATAKDARGAHSSTIVRVVPAATKIEITAPAEYDLNNGDVLFVKADALTGVEGYTSQDLMWTASDKKIVASVEAGSSYDEEWAMVEGAYVYLTGKTGKVTLTATATDGTGVKASVTINVVQSPTEVVLNKHEAVMAATSSLTLKATVGPQNATNKSVSWSIDCVAVEDAEIGGMKEIKASDIGAKVVDGKLTVNSKLFSKLYAETGNPVSVVVKATAKKAMPNGEYAVDYCHVTVGPATKSVSISAPALNRVVNGKTLKIDNDAILVLAADPTPETAGKMFSWKSSSTKIAKVVTNADGSVTVQPTGKTGTVTITATATDGSKKSASVKVKIVNKVDALTADASKFVLSGSTKGRSFDLNKLLTVSPANASDKSVTWSIAEWSKADAAANKITVSSSGKLTAKMNVKEPVTLYVMAKANDGFGASTGVMVTITPATTKVTIVDVEGVEITGTQKVVVGDSLVISATSDPELAADQFSWKSSNTKYAQVVIDEEGIVSVVGKKAGTVTITATAKDGSGKTDTIKVQVIKGE